MASSDLKLDSATSSANGTDPGSAQADSTNSDVDGTDDSVQEHANPAQDDADGEARGNKRTSSSRRTVSISVRTLLASALILTLTVAVGVLAWLYVGSRTELAAQARQGADYQRAEQVASDYAVSAAAVNFRDLASWKQNLVKGTTPELNDKLQKAATSMEQILVPMQWDSTSSALAAKVRSDTNGVYNVDTFVSVLTKSVQAPDGLQSTATYRITIDSNNNWLISEVGGIDAVVGQR